jgi:hypothetical protein
VRNQAFEPDDVRCGPADDERRLQAQNPEVLIAEPGNDFSEEATSEREMPCLFDGMNPVDLAQQGMSRRLCESSALDEVEGLLAGQSRKEEERCEVSPGFREPVVALPCGFR